MSDIGDQLKDSVRDVKDRLDHIERRFAVILWQVHLVTAGFAVMLVKVFSQ